MLRKSKYSKIYENYENPRVENNKAGSEYLKVSESIIIIWKLQIYDGTRGFSIDQLKQNNFHRRFDQMLKPSSGLKMLYSKRQRNLFSFKLVYRKPAHHSGASWELQSSLQIYNEVSMESACLRMGTAPWIIGNQWEWKLATAARRWRWKIYMRSKKVSDYNEINNIFASFKFIAAW